MRIAYITSGAAGMYCGSCMRDNTLAAALQELGHDCVLVPTYTPIRTDETDVSLHRVFFGGVGIYLEQNYALFRRMPGFLRRWLSAPGLLRWVTKSGMKVRPEDLGALTVSMLQGSAGNQRRDVDDLVNWLANEFRPDVVVLTNILIAALTPTLKARLTVPVICTLQGDDIFLDWLPATYREQCFKLIQGIIPHLDGYLTTSRYYADFMAEYLKLPRDRIDVVLPGLNLKGFDAAPTASKSDDLTIGYLARICPEKGLHVLIEAFNLLRQRPGLPPCRLRAAGYVGERDKAYLADLLKQIEQQGWPDQFQYLGELTHEGKLAFLQSLDLFSVPTTYREPKGLYLLEAWASGLAAVQPRHGSFPELVEQTGGGVLVEPNDPKALADGLERLLHHPEDRARLGQAGRAAVWERFQARRMAEETQEVLKKYVASV